MQLTELLFQNVRGLGAQGQLPLRPGYVVFVSPAMPLRGAVLAALYPGAGDEKKLAEGAGPTRIGVGIVPGTPGAPYRLLRELGGERQLQRVDPASNRYATISKDALEVDSFLRLECGLPAAETYASFFTLEASELPTQRGRLEPKAAGGDPQRVAALKAELESTRKFEDAQDTLFKITDRIRELDKLAAEVSAIEAELREIDDKRAKVPYEAAQRADLIARIKRQPAEEKKRDEELGAINVARRRLRDFAPPRPEPFHKNTLFSGGIAAGLAIDALAFVFKKPVIALVGLLGFGAALFVVLKWIDADQADEENLRAFDDLKAREDRVKKGYQQDQLTLNAAMRAASVEFVSDLQTLFQERDVLDQRRQPVLEKLQKLKEGSDWPKLSEERQRLIAEKGTLEAAVSAQGFARGLGAIEAELKEALGLESSAPKKAPALPDADVPKMLFARGAEAVGSAPEALAAAIEPRLAAYLTALTDKRVAGGRMDAEGHLMLSTPDGRWGPYAGLPLPLRDLAYVALRLALLERVCGQKKVPVIVDDALAPLEPPKRQLAARMLKGIAAQAQVLHRSSEPPPAGVADHVVQPP